MNKKLSENNINDIVELYLNNIPSAQIAQSFNVAQKTIYCVLKKHGIICDKKDYVKRYTPQIINLYSSGFNTAEIAELIKASSTQINRILKDNKITLRPVGHGAKIYNFDKTSFDVIDSHEKAYLLGFFYADGWSSITDYTIGINIQEQDKYILEEFSKILKNERPLMKIKTTGNRQAQYRLIINNKYFYNRMVEWGIANDKTNKAKFPYKLNSNYYASFILGLFDGDGSIALDNSGKYQKNHQGRFQIAGCPELLYEVQKILIKNCKLRNVKLLNIDCNSEVNVKSLKYSGNEQLLKIRDYIYNGSTIYLFRKKNKFDQLKVIGQGNHTCSEKAKENMKKSWKKRLNYIPIEEIIKLRNNGLLYREIADILGINTGSVARKINQARLQGFDI